MPQPPATLTLRYCATCGWQSPTHAGSHLAGDTFDLCPGTVQTLTYRLDAGQPEPPPAHNWVPVDVFAGPVQARCTHCGAHEWVMTMERDPVCPGPWERLGVPNTTEET